MIRDPALIAEVFRSCEDELAALQERKDLTSYLDVNALLAKSFLLSCASFYEEEITKIAQRVLESGRHRTNVQAWLQSAAVDGQFYKWFDFRGAKNVNPFLAKFGADFKDEMRLVLDSRVTRQQAERDFLVLCQRRNECVHRNYAAYGLELTLKDIYDKHRSAMRFVRAVDYGARKWLVGPEDAS